MILKSRRASREAALQALYGCDLLQEFTPELINLYFTLHHPGALQDPALKEHFDFARSLIDGASANLAAIDALISAASAHWSIHRMCRIDRNILRLGTFELGFVADVPVSVSINEAIELAKLYGGDDSPNFVNGVIDQVAKNLGRNDAFREVMARKSAAKSANA